MHLSHLIPEPLQHFSNSKHIPCTHIGQLSSPLFCCSSNSSSLCSKFDVESALEQTGRCFKNWAVMCVTSLVAMSMAVGHYQARDCPLDYNDIFLIGDCQCFLISVAFGIIVAALALTMMVTVCFLIERQNLKLIMERHIISYCSWFICSWSCLFNGCWWVRISSWQFLLLHLVIFHCVGHASTCLLQRVLVQQQCRAGTATSNCTTWSCL